MKTEVSISERLKDLRVEKKLNLEELAELTGISKSALGSYELDTPREMNHKNLIALADFYKVSVDYLLGRTENKNLPNAPLSELRLSDATVELLKSGSINNRLLCELVTHEKFAELLTDVEIYVDGLAASRFHDLKQSLAADRARLLEEHPEAVTDRAFRIFDAGMIEEDVFSAISRTRHGTLSSATYEKPTKRILRVRRSQRLPMKYSWKSGVSCSHPSTIRLTRFWKRSAKASR